MPYYDETFIYDDNQNQRRNKRSYHVYKNGLNPLRLLEHGDVKQSLDGRGTSAIKLNNKNNKYRGRAKLETSASSRTKYTSPDIIIDHCPYINTVENNRYCDIRNNNVFPLTSCKSYDNLTFRNVKKIEDAKYTALKNGVSLQNLADQEEHMKHYVSSKDYVGTVSCRDSVKNSYSVAEARRRPSPRRFSRGTPAPGVGVYRQICSESANRRTNEGEGNETGSGHRGSLRGANKLARRARSFKDDLIERINNMRSPAQQHHPPHLSAIRSHSPLSPKQRNMGTKPVNAEEGEVTPAKELERLVKEVTFGLKHFSDVITKRKLEMLPDNGTIVFESIANIHKAIKPYCSRTPTLMSAVKKLCTALAMLIRLCDEISALSFRADAGNEELDTSAAALSPEHVSAVVCGVTSSVEEVAALARQHMARPALAPRPALVSPRDTTQRKSLPDIPLTPKELSQLTGETGNENSGVRASHSSESILDAPDSPPPKPVRPNRKIELAPPLPPKRKSANDNSLLALSIDRLSLQSHSSGSLDSMLNVSNDEERLARDAPAHDHVFATPPNAGMLGVCSCNSASDVRSSLDSHESHMNHLHAHSHSNHNRFSNESGFVSVGQAEVSGEHIAFSSHHYSSHSDSSMFNSSDCVTEMKSTMQSFESRMNFVSLNSVTTHHSVSTKLASITSDESETPPELPVKTRRNRADIQQYFPNVEIRKSPVCTLHGDARPHTLADHNRPPPLPLKKKHMFQSVAYSVMAYMEMFGNCSHPPSNPAAAPDMFRHSIHTYNLASAQHTSAGAISVQRHQQVQRTIAQSVTVQHFGTPPLSGSDDSMSMITSGSTSPILLEPPALPPKMSKNKQIQFNTSNELLPPPSPRPSSHSSSADESVLNNVNSDESYVSSTPGKFPLEDELEMIVKSPTPSPVPSKRSESDEPTAAPTEAAVEGEGSPAAGAAGAGEGAGGGDAVDIILQTDVSPWLLLKVTGKDESEVRGGHPDSLIVLATKATKDFAYQEAFLATYRTWVSPSGLVARLVRRAHHYRPRPHELRSTLSLLTRVVADLTLADLDGPLMQEIMEFIYWLVEAEELAIAKALRQILVDKQKQIHNQQSNHRYEYETPCVSLRRDTLLDFKSVELAEQMTVMDAVLFARITTAEVLSWPRDQSEESSPNLTRFTAHFNKMSYWARSRILEQDEAEKREKYASKFLKVMKALRKLNNFNSYLALVSALDSPPVRRLDWPRAIKDALNDFCAIIEPSSSFRAYRMALAETQPPCIPYIGLVLQDLTFVHIGNPDLLPDGNINFTKRWQQYHIMENMKRFHKDKQYKIKKNERIQAMFNEFDDVLSEEAMWQISETIKPRPGRAKPAAAPAPPAAAPAAPPAQAALPPRAPAAHTAA